MRRRVVVHLMVSTLWALSVAGPGLAPAAASLICDGTIQVVTHPQSGQTLGAVDASSSRTAWAVGKHVVGTVEQTWTERWDGETWSRVPSPNMDPLSPKGRNQPDTNVLEDVAVLGAADAWAVGWYHHPGTKTTPGSDRALAMHWDGSAWSIADLPAISGSHRLRAVDAAATDDVWAVGETASTAIVMHWDGSAWSEVPVGDPGPSIDSLYGVAAISKTDAWAVGTTDAGRDTLALRWDGMSWVRWPSPDGGSGSNVLFDAARTWGSGVVAAGSFSSATDPVIRTLALRWDGTQWSKMRTPNPGDYRNSLHSVARVSGLGVWAAGFQEDLPGSPAPLLVRKSTGWKVMPVPDLGGPATLVDVSGAQSHLWAVGGVSGSSPSSLILGLCEA